jgi:hypothetical protein
VRSPPGAVARIVLASAAAWAGLALSRRVVAAPLSTELSVEREDAAADCPDAAGLARLVERIVGPGAGGPVVRPGGDVRAAVRFSRGAATYEAALALTGARQGARTLTDTGPTCAALGRAVAITMALLLDAGLDSEAPRPPPPTPVAVAVASPAVAPLASSRASSSRASSSPASRATDGTLAVTLGPALGLVGGATLASGLAVMMGVGRHLALSLDGQYVAPRGTAFDAGEVDVTLLAARLRACGVLDNEGAVRLGACAAGAAGRLRGEGRGYAFADGVATLTWAAAGGGIEASRALGRRWRAGLSADALVPLRKSTFSITNRGVAFQSSPVSVMLEASFGVVLW